MISPHSSSSSYAKHSTQPSQSLCKDARCLYKTDGAALTPQFCEVTRKTREGEGLWEKCQNCALVINRSGVKVEEVEDFYNSTYIVKNSYKQGATLSPREHFEARLATAQHIADYLRPYLKKHMHVFELGGATGELLYLIKDQVASCFNNEINQQYTDFSIQDLGMQGSSEDYFKLTFERPFDLILSVNTIDHMYETGKAVEKIHQDLISGGLAYIEVPNDHQALRQFLPEPSRSKFEEFMYQRAHYYSFTEETLSKLLVQTGFEIIDIGTRHDYNLRNFLNWYFTGERQSGITVAKGKGVFFSGDSHFEHEMDEMLLKVDQEFKKIINRNKAGELLRALVKKRS